MKITVIFELKSRAGAPKNVHRLRLRTVDAKSLIEGVEKAKKIMKLKDYRLFSAESNYLILTKHEVNQYNLNEGRKK